MNEGWGLSGPRWVAGMLVPQGSPVCKAAKDGGAHQHPGHVDGLSQVTEGAGLAHQIPLQGREGRSSYSLRQQPSMPPQPPRTSITMVDGKTLRL